MKLLPKISAFILVSFLILVPELVVAQGLVTCTGFDCDFCKFVSMIERVTDFLVSVLIIIATIMLAVTGIQMAYTAAGGGEAREILKERMTNIVIGFVLIIASWVLVDTLLKALVTDDLAQNWRTPIPELCGVQTQPIRFDPDTGFEPGSDDGSGGGDVTPSGNLVEYGGKQFDSAVVDKVSHIDNNFDLSVTSGYRSPEHNASVGGSPTSYHLSGRAADFVGSRSEMERAKAWAEANGAVETLIHDAGSGTHLHVAF